MTRSDIADVRVKKRISELWSWMKLHTAGHCGRWGRCGVWIGPGKSSELVQSAITGACLRMRHRPSA